MRKVSQLRTAEPAPVEAFVEPDTEEAPGGLPRRLLVVITLLIVIALLAVGVLVFSGAGPRGVWDSFRADAEPMDADVVRGREWAAAALDEPVSALTSRPTRGEPLELVTDWCEKGVNTLAKNDGFTLRCVYQRAVVVPLKESGLVQTSQDIGAGLMDSGWSVANQPGATGAVSDLDVSVDTLKVVRTGSYVKGDDGPRPKLRVGVKAEAGDGGLPFAAWERAAESGNAVFRDVPQGDERAFQRMLQADGLRAVALQTLVYYYDG